jgi:opacity protein-like surface antigen
MLRSNLSKLFGTGILVAGLAVLPLSFASTAKAEATNDYQVGRHDLAIPSTNNSERSTSYQNSNGQMPNNYQLGRHNGTGTNMMDAGKSTTSMPKENMRSESVNNYQILRHG